MVDYNSARSVLRKKLRKSIDSTELLLASKNPGSIYDEHDVSEITIGKLKLQLALNSILMEEAKDDGEKKKLEEKRKELQDALNQELQDDADLLNIIVEYLTLRGKEDVARRFEILKYIRQSEIGS
jgi:hypothetical protein